MKENVGDVVLNFEVSGQGPDLLLLHGWGHDLNTWQKVIPELEKQYRVWCLDLPGFGQSSLPGQAWSLKNYADVVAGFVQQRNLTGVTLIGHSFGGRIAILLAASRPIWLKSLILVDSAGLIPKRTLKRTTVWVLAKVGKFFSGLMPQERRNHWRHKFHQVVGAEDYDKAGDLRPIFVKIIERDLTPELKTIVVPTTIIWGEEDMITPLDQAKYIKENIVGSKLIVLPGVGHVPFQESPGLFIRAIKELFLNTPS